MSDDPGEAEEIAAAIEGDVDAPDLDGDPGADELDEPTSASSTSWWGRLLRPTAEMDLDHPHLATWSPESGGLRRLKRGVYGLVGTDHGTVLEDLLVGSLEAAYNALWWAENEDGDDLEGGIQGQDPHADQGDDW